MAFIIGGAISAVGSYMSSQNAAGAAGDASKAQSEAASGAINAQSQQLQQTAGNLKPYLDAGSAANSQLMTLLGINNDASRFKQELQSEGFNLASNWQPDQADVAKYAAANPATANPQFGSLLKQFTGKDLENSPGYQFQLQQGNQALTNKRAATGSLLSGAAVKEAERYNQDYASTAFNTAFNQDMSQKQFTLGSLSGVAGAGQNAAVSQGGFGANAANQNSSLMTQQGNANAAGIVGGANATSAGFNNAINAATNANTLRSVFGGGGNTGYTTNQMGGMDGLGGLG